MKMLSKLMLLAVPALALAGCGGNGDKTCGISSDLTKVCVQNPTHNLPEGIWAGASTSEQSVLTIVLETGQYYNVYTSSGAFDALVEGTMTATNNPLANPVNTFTDPAAVAFVGTSVVTASDLEGFFTPQVSITGTAGSLGFNGNYNTVYNTPLAVSDITGTWIDAVANGTSSMTVNANGTFTGATQGCAMSGTLTPRPTGKHILDGTVLLQNGTSACGFGNGATLNFEMTDISGQITAAGVTAQRTLPFVLSLVR